MLTYEVSKRWRLGLTGRYENLRFRLAPDNAVPNGVGEDENFAIMGTVSDELFRGSYVTGFFGWFWW
ncbi:MAG: hypothetical protein OES84_05495 [Kiritimatiellaceae bacterium]|nr:hypothetical protein [Kiritimatiellaceae bacterium]